MGLAREIKNLVSTYAVAPVERSYELLIDVDLGIVVEAIEDQRPSVSLIKFRAIENVAKTWSKSSKVSSV